MKPLSTGQRELLANAAEAYHTQLFDNNAQWARDYLNSRGFGQETAKKFLLGAVNTPFVPEHERFVGMVSIANFCAAGESGAHVVGLKFRNLTGEGGKYQQPTHQVARLFNLRALQEAKDLIVITEGEADAITVDKIGLPCIGVPGAQSWGKNSYRSRLLAGFERVVLIRDADAAGEELVRSLADIDNLEVRVPPDPFKDVNEYWVATHDAEGIRKWITGT